MKMTRVLGLLALAGACAFGLAGCSSSDYAPVSGVVTLNGKPARNVMVMFQPTATKDKPNPGRGSTCFTDENGRFVMKTDDGMTGAAIGKHRVRISSVYSEKLHGYEVWDHDANKAVRADADPIPVDWNAESKKEIEVPPGGTDQANFEIWTKKK